MKRVIVRAELIYKERELEMPDDWDGNTRELAAAFLRALDAEIDLERDIIGDEEETKE